MQMWRLRSSLHKLGLVCWWRGHWRSLLKTRNRKLNFLWKIYCMLGRWIRQHIQLQKPSFHSSFSGTTWTCGPGPTQYVKSLVLLFVFSRIFFPFLFIRFAVSLEKKSEYWWTWYVCMHSDFSCRTDPACTGIGNTHIFWQKWIPMGAHTNHHYKRLWGCWWDVPSDYAF